MNTHTSTIILAAGKGTRMNSDLPKVLHQIDAKHSLLTKLLQTIEQAHLQDVYIVVGYKKELVIEHVQKWADKNASTLNIRFIEQKEQKGTGHAIQSVKPYIQNQDNHYLILLGDVPNISHKSILHIISQLDSVNAVVASIQLDDPYGYGRILRNAENYLTEIIEEKDATTDIQKIQEVNTGIMAFQGSHLWKHIDELNNNNQKSEYYITDIIRILNKNQYKIGLAFFENQGEFLGINSQAQLKQLKLQV